MASMLSTKSVGTTAFQASRKPARGVACRAQREAIDRRAALSALALLPAAFYAPRALALIPDEEDEEMVEKAKANRKAKLQQDKQVAREFLSGEGIKDVADGKDLPIVQQAVFKLAEAGSKLEAGDVTAASAALSGAWLSSFAGASKGLSSTATAQDGAQAVADSLASLKAVADTGDLKGAKRQFVATVGPLRAATPIWAQQASLRSCTFGQPGLRPGARPPPRAACRPELLACRLQVSSLSGWASGAGLSSSLKGL
jgi:hypothetical protein